MTSTERGDRPGLIARTRDWFSTGRVRLKAAAATVVILGVLAGIGGASVVGFGLYNTSAKEGHFPGVSWMLGTTFDQSTKLRAPSEKKVPPLDDAMVRLGARHFDAACTACHAAPGVVRTATMQRMLPEPPDAAVVSSRWDPRHIAWIVHEGVKATGMPAWPALRWDDVWPVAAFVDRIETMSAQTYADLTRLPQTDGPRGADYCAGCHGTAGVSGNPYIPRLDIQDPEYLILALETYAQSRRDSGIMAHASTEVDPAAFDDLAAFFAGEPGPAADVGEQPAADPSTPPQTEFDPRVVADGRQLALAETGDPDIPSCAACHGPDRVEEWNAFPALGGQYRPYLEAQLRLWRDGKRGGGERAELMRIAAQNLTDREIEALASYYASLAPGTR
jgi:cytochrome c oxidase subunit 1